MTSEDDGISRPDTIITVHPESKKFAVHQQSSKQSSLHTSAASVDDDSKHKRQVVDDRLNEQKKLGFFARWKARKTGDKPAADVSGNEKPPADGGDAAVPTKDATPPPVGISELFRYTTRLELFINLVGLVCAAAAGAAQPVMSIIFGNITNTFVKFGSTLTDFANGSASQSDLDAASAHFRHVAALDASYLVYIGLGVLVTTFLYMYGWVYTGEMGSRRVREKYLQAILRQDIAYFDNVGAGEVASRIQTDTHLIQQGISEKVAIAVQFLSSFVSGFIVGYIRSWRLALALSSILPCIIISGAIMNKFLSKYMQDALKHAAEGGSIAEEIISTVRTAQAFGTQRILSELYDSHIEVGHIADLKAATVQGFGLSIFFFVIYASYALAFSFGTTLIIHGHADAAVVVTVFLAIFIGSFSLAMLAPEMQAISHAQGAAAKLFTTIDRVPSIDSSDPSGQKPSHVVGEIVLENVEFNYPSRPDVPVVKDLSISFPAGQTTALVGASGSGKSTIVSLMERFYDPLKGRVLLDGVDLKDLNVKWLRTQIGLVSQEPVLFSTSIKGNVAHGLIGTRWENASEEEQFKLIREACVKANADNFITKLPLGYDTPVGERGFLLSGGQKQRVAIARAIVSDPKVLLLDEATSALDTRSEGVVQDALDKAAAGRTTITIAHRLSTIKNAARIYVMGKGVILESGTHNELMDKEGGAYARLVQAQELRELEEAAEAEAENRATEGAFVKEKGSAAVTEKANSRELELDDIPLGRKNTNQSLASEIVEQKKQREKPNGEKEYSMYELFKRMGGMQRNVWKSYLFGAIFAALSGMVYPAFGIVYAKAVTTFQITNDNHRLRHDGDRNALWFFLIAILSMIFLGFQNYMFAAAAANLTHKLRSLTFRAILRQDIEFFDEDEHSTGSLTANLSGNPQKVNGLAGVTLGTIVQSIVTIIAGAIVGLVFQWKLALVGIACMPLLISAGYIRLRVVTLKDQVNKKAHEQSAQIACEAAGSIRTVASLTREEDCCNIYSKSLDVPLKRSNRASFYSNLIYAISQSMILFVIALVFWFGSERVSRQEFGTTAFFVCLFSVVYGAMQAGSVFSFVPDISSAKGAGNDILKLIDMKPEIDAESTEGKVLDKGEVQGQIHFEGVQFRYPTRPGVRVLRDLNLKVEPGTYIALVGASGCGKSTIIQLIERFYDPVSGKIALDGHNITGLNVQEYRKHVALVSQEPTLYSGTIRFNILLGAVKPHSEVTQEDIEAVCRDANIWDFIQSLPNGFDTEVGGKGSQLSGGQKQRIAIARALLRNPKVLLLDEATSALDSDSEKVVQDALDKAARGRTTIAIAHRLSTIQNADRIYFIKEGRVSESGSHDELLAVRGDYYEFVQLQALSKQQIP